MPEKNQIQTWWNRFPMTYGDRHGEVISSPMGTREFFRELDERVFQEARYAHKHPPLFSGIFDYEKFRGKRVLEVGCGMGMLAQRFAEHGAVLTALDLTPQAVRQTRKRFELFGLSGGIFVGDAENLAFPNSFFDFVYSWGVLHHTPDTARTIREIHRVLRPGGETMVMLYHKHSLHRWYDMLVWEGIINLERHFLSREEIVSRYADGKELEGNPLTRTYSRQEGRELFSMFSSVTLEVCGNLESEYRNFLPLIWKYIPGYLRDFYAGKVGWFLLIRAKK
jgi:SAM-dependent methyltransferase